MPDSAARQLDIVYAERGAYLPEALARIDYLLRDFRSGDVHPIDPRLLDILAAVQARTGSTGRYEVISGFRSRATCARPPSCSRRVVSATTPPTTSCTSTPGA